MTTSIKAKPELFISCSDAGLAEKIRLQDDDIVCLAKAEKAVVVTSLDDVPKGCALVVVNESVQVWYTISILKRFNPVFRSISI